MRSVPARSSRPDDLSKVRDHQVGILFLHRDARADGAAANAQVTQVVRGLGDAPHAALDRVRVRVELLAESNRHRVLQMRATGFDDVVELLTLGGERRAQVLERAHERPELRETREPDVRRNRVVGRLRHVHVVVRMHGRVLAPRAAEELVGAIGQHLVGVHVVRRAGARLVRVDDELVAMLAGEHLVGGRDDGVGEPRVEAARLLVRERRGLLDPDLRRDERLERREAADREVLPRAERLDAVERVGRDVERAQRVFLVAKGRHER